MSGEGIPTRLLVVDLDGTVRWGRDELGRFVNGPRDVVVFPEAVERMGEWRSAGGRIVAVSNQGGIALGHLSLADCVAAMKRTDELCEYLIEEITFCPHFPTVPDPEMARCWCRKPSPGGLVRAVVKMEFAHGERYPPHLGLVVGDRPEDEELARLAGFPFAWAADWRAGRVP